MFVKDPHEILDGFESLRRHHFAKEDLRLSQVLDIPIDSNERVLDVGIGPGLYLKQWLEATASKNVHFTLVDHSEPALKICREIAHSANAPDRVKTEALDLMKLKSSGLGPFDVIFVGNTIEYIRQPADYIRRQLIPLLNKRGRLVIRDLDCSYMSCSLVDPALNSKVVYSRIRNGQHTSLTTPHYHDAFVGRNLAKIATDSGLKDIELTPYFIEFKHPLSQAQALYLSRLHQTWYVDDALDILTSEEKKLWSSAFDVSDPQSTINSKDFYYVEAEFLVSGTV